MNFSNTIKTIFGNIKKRITTAWRELGGYTASFSVFGKDIYANEVVRACIRTLAEHTSKANVKIIRTKDGEISETDGKLQKMIQYRPNPFMNGKDFLAKCRTLYEINNTLFIYVMRDESGDCTGLYPMPAATYEAVESNGGLYIKFYFNSGDVMVHAWEDLAVLRKDYNKSDIFGDDNTAILTSLDLLNTTNEGMANAIKSTANIRGVLKTTKAMLSDDNVKKNKERFEADYMSMTNKSGIVSIDSTQEYTPINIQPQLANYKSIEELRNNIYRYYGMNDDIVMSKATADVRESFYESKIEPFLLALGLELSCAIFYRMTRNYNKEIIFESNRMSYMSMTEKLALVAMVDRGAMTPNEWRQALNLAPIAGGENPIRRLDTATVASTEENPKEGEDANITE